MDSLQTKGHLNIYNNFLIFKYFREERRVFLPKSLFPQLLPSQIVYANSFPLSRAIRDEALRLQHYC